MNHIRVLIFIFVAKFFNIQGQPPLPFNTTKQNNLEKCDFYSDSFFLNCDNINNFQIDTTQVTLVETLRIKPRLSRKFDNTLNLTNLNGKLQNGHKVFLENFNEFSLDSNPFLVINSSGELLELNNINIYFTGNLDFNSKPLFSSFGNIVFNNKVNYSNKLNKLAFSNINLKRLLITNLSDDNSLSFLPEAHANLNANIQSLEVFDSKLTKLSSFLDEDVFKTLKKLIYHSSNPNFIIENNLFQKFKNLSEFQLYFPDLNTYIKTRNFEWTESLNYDIFVNSEDLVFATKQFKLKIVDLSEVYMFPDSDFCQFAKFPHNKAVFPIIESAKNLVCTCTLAYLIQFISFYQNSQEIFTQSVTNCKLSSDFDQVMESCKFSERIEKCNQKTTITEDTTSSIFETSTEESIFEISTKEPIFETKTNEQIFDTTTSINLPDTSTTLELKSTAKTLISTIKTSFFTETLESLLFSSTKTSTIFSSLELTQNNSTIITQESITSFVTNSSSPLKNTTVSFENTSFSTNLTTDENLYVTSNLLQTHSTSFFSSKASTLLSLTSSLKSNFTTKIPTSDQTSVSIGVIAGSVIGGIVGVILISVTIYYIYRFLKRKKAVEPSLNQHEMNKI